MSLDTVSIVDAVASHAQSSGRFETVIKHEPRVAPGMGVSASIFLDRIEAYQQHSGLAVTSAWVLINVRLAMSMMHEPTEDIDWRLLGGAVDVLMTDFCGDFTLGGLISHVDILGQGRQGLRAVGGYLEQDHKLFRVSTIELPLVVNDCWTQAA